MAQYQYTDALKNVYTLIVQGTVVACDQNRIEVSLLHFAYSLRPDGSAVHLRIITAAAKAGLAELRRVTKLDWKIA